MIDFGPLAELFKQFRYEEPVEFDVPYEEEAILGTALSYLSMRFVASPVMSEGNQKLDRRVLIFNLPPIKSCPNNKSCKDTCYAVPFYRQYPDVWERYDANFEMAKTDLGRLSRYIVRQIREKKESRAGLVAVRVHSSGDFFSQDYLNMWATIARELPDVKFYAYTKADKVLDFRPLDELPNFNVIRSFINGRFRNYGAPEYVAKVKSQVSDAYICPAIHRPEVHCGDQCNYCISGQKPLFYIHGTMKAAGALPEREYDVDYMRRYKRGGFKEKRPARKGLDKALAPAVG